MIENGSTKLSFGNKCPLLRGCSPTPFRSIATRFSQRMRYFCAPISIDNKLSLNNIAGKLTDMSKLKQVLLGSTIFIQKERIYHDRLPDPVPIPIGNHWNIEGQLVDLQ